MLKEHSELQISTTWLYTEFDCGPQATLGILLGRQNHSAASKTCREPVSTEMILKIKRM
jgi:hypothetical protein